MIKSLRPTAKEALIEAAFDVFSRDPSASLSDIVERAGVGRATLHRHFASREDLIRALALIAIEEMEAVTEAACENVSSYEEAFRRMLGALIPLGDRYGFLSREPIEDDPDIVAEFDRIKADMWKMIEEAKTEGVFDPDVSTAWIAQAFDHLLYAAWESVHAEEVTPAQAADLAWRTLTNGLGRATR